MVRDCPEGWTFEWRVRDTKDESGESGPGRWDSKYIGALRPGQAWLIQVVIGRHVWLDGTGQGEWQRCHATWRQGQVIL